MFGNIVPPGGTAIDVGANQGVFAYAFSTIADRVEAFEPRILNSVEFCAANAWRTRARARNRTFQPVGEG